MSEFVRIQLYVGTGFAGASHRDIYEHPREDWEEMTEGEREAFLDELAAEYLNERCECSASVIE